MTKSNHMYMAHDLEDQLFYDPILNFAIQIKINPDLIANGDERLVTNAKEAGGATSVARRSPTNV